MGRERNDNRVHTKRERKRERKKSLRDKEGESELSAEEELLDRVN